MATFFYVYILESIPDPERHYVGFTGDLKERMREHNAGTSPHNAKHGRCLNFERHLNSASGRACARKRL